MAGLALLFSIVALIFAYLAYRNSGGTSDELKEKVENLGITTENFREKTADALGRIEKLVRGEGNQVEEKETAQDQEKTGEDEPPQA